MMKDLQNITISACTNMEQWSINTFIIWNIHSKTLVKHSQFDQKVPDIDEHVFNNSVAFVDKTLLVLFHEKIK